MKKSILALITMAVLGSGSVMAAPAGTVELKWQGTVLGEIGLNEQYFIKNTGFTDYKDVGELEFELGSDGTSPVATNLLKATEFSFQVTKKEASESEAQPVGFKLALIDYTLARSNEDGSEVNKTGNILKVTVTDELGVNQTENFASMENSINEAKVTLAAGENIGLLEKDDVVSVATVLQIEADA